MMVKTYRGPLPIHPRRYEFLLSTCRSGDLSVVPSHGEEHDACDTICPYRDTMREDAMEFGDPFASFFALAQQELKIAKRVAPYNACAMSKVTSIDEHDEERRK